MPHAHGCGLREGVLRQTCSKPIPTFKVATMYNVLLLLVKLEVQFVESHASRGFLAGQMDGEPKEELSDTRVVCRGTGSGDSGWGCGSGGSNSNLHDFDLKAGA
eukprot:1157276-Pelagomonas_calceolata.AAC.2